MARCAALMESSARHRTRDSVSPPDDCPFERRDIQLAISPEIAVEYEEILDRLGVPPNLLNEFIRDLPTRETVTWVHLGRRIKMERDPDDEIILATADSANAKYLVTYDKDLLELPWEQRRRFKFEIVTPAQLLERTA